MCAFPNEISARKKKKKKTTNLLFCPGKAFAVGSSALVRATNFSELAQVSAKWNFLETQFPPSDGAEDKLHSAEMRTESGERTMLILLDPLHQPLQPPLSI